MNFPGTPWKTKASLANALDYETKINVYRRVSFIKTFMYTKNQNTIFHQNGIFIKTDNRISIFREFLSLKIEILYIY